MSGNNQNPKNASRRRAIGTLAGLMGLGLSAGAVNALAQHTVASGQPLRAGSVLTLAQMHCLAALVDVVIPPTDTPGASDVGAHWYLDHHLHVCIDKPQQARLQALLDKLDAVGDGSDQLPFAAVSAERQRGLIEQLQNADGAFDSDDRTSWGQLKPLIVFAYYTSEAGATEELTYQAIPGGYRGDVPFSQIERAWSLQPFI